MAMAPTDTQLREIAAGRAELAIGEDMRRKVIVKRNKASARIISRHADATTVAATGGSDRQIAAAYHRWQASVRARRRYDAILGRLDGVIGGIRDRLDDLVIGLGDPLAALDGKLPIALFPVRIETRFVDDVLKLRIFPDIAQIDQLEEQLTAEEQEHGRRYWTFRWEGEDPSRAWGRAIAGKKPNRVAWIIAQTRPANLDRIGSGEPLFHDLELRPKGPTKAPEAKLLPARWTVAGFRNGTEVMRKQSRMVRRPLPVGVAPEAHADTTVARPDPLRDLAKDNQDTLAIDDAARWLVDFDEAVAAGMAVTITANDDADVMQGYARLVVVGVDHRLAPDRATDELERTLQAHYYSDGLGFVAAGTPTNASENDVVAPRPTATDPADIAETSGGNAAALASVLGLDVATVANRAAGAADVHGDHAADMITALWEPAMGYFLRQIMEPALSEADIAQVRSHAIRFVRARGPLPILRIGSQPLGILPITSVPGYVAQADENLVAAAVKAMWPFWLHSTGKALRLGDSDDPSVDLVALLQRTHRSVTYRLREVLGPVAVANSEGMNDLASYQTVVALFTLAIMGLTGVRPKIVDMTVRDDHRVLPIPLVIGKAPGPDPLEEDYVVRVLSRVSSFGGYGHLRKDAEDASTLLEALLIHAADLEMVRASAGLVIDHLGLDIDLVGALVEPELRLEAADGASPTYTTDRISDARVVSTVSSDRLNIAPRSLATGRLHSVSGKHTIADHLAAQKASELRRRRASAQFAGFRDALAGLRGLATQELHDLTADTLDIFSYRYDAWATSLATRRLDAQRGARAAGIHVGGYGWVEDLRPRTTLASAGLIHAPSIAHATTAAVLRSGHLARSDADADPLAIKLTSRRARLAQRLVDGMRSGQSLAALLGYRWERALRDRGVEYAAYILPVRQAHPLPETRDRETTEPVEAIAARNVADGVALAELDAAGRTALLAEAGVTAAHAPALRAELDALADALDAVGDLLMAEGIYQAVLGNSERAAAALDALDRQTPLPEVGVTKTPRTGHGIGYRVLVALDEDRPPAAWRRLADLRGDAAPRVNAWVGQVLGDPRQYRFGAEILDAEGNVVDMIALTLADLRLSPLSAVLATSTSDDQASELERRLESMFFSAAAVPEGGGLRALPGPVPDDPAAVGLGEFLAAAAAVLDLLASARAADARDLTHPTAAASPNPDAAEIAARADAVVAALQDVGAIDAEAIPGLSDDALANLLDDTAALGLPGTVPQSKTREQLEKLAARAVRQASDRLAAVNALVPGDTGSAFAAASYHAARLRAVLGDGFPAIPIEVVGSDVTDALNGAAKDPDLLAQDLLAPTEWLQRHALVRTGVDRLWLVLAGAEARESGVDATQLMVTQLPHERGRPWVARPEAFTDGPPAADLSIVIHRTATGDLGPRVAALAIDQWNELVPSAAETTGVSFHFDGPGARAPQTALLAVNPDPDSPQWSEDLLLDILTQAAELSKMRTLDLDDIVAAGRFLPANYLPFDIEGNVASFDWIKVLAAARVEWNWVEIDQ